VVQPGAHRTRSDWITVISAACIAIGWFGMDSLEVRFGPLSQGTRFYELLAVLRHPAALLFGVGDGYAIEVIAFAALCLAALAAVLAPQFTPVLAVRRPGALAGVLPLALMVLMGVALYRSGVRLDEGAPPGSMRGDLLRLAQDALQRAQGQLARHVTAGFGLYLSLSASLLLAARSCTRRRVPLVLPAGDYPPG
jgi:hypothetical protein